MTLPPEGWWSQPVHRIAETHRFIRPQILRALEQTMFTAETRRASGGHQTYLQLWQAHRGPEFFDMGTLVRLGTTLEMLMRDYYRQGRDEATGGSLKVSTGVFQRLLPWTDNNVIELYRRDVRYDLTTNHSLHRVTQLMLQRHLYAHASGLVSDRYIDDWKQLTGEDLRQEPVLSGYPAEDVYWFRPLGELDAFIHDVSEFFAAFPTS
jgi:hypothetical protein